MGNTNFQTIHQMGTAISDLVKQATGRDDVQNIDMEHITVAQNHHYEEVDLSGQVVSFQAGEAGLPFEKLDVQIKPVQDLHGYDSPWPAGGGKNLYNKDADYYGQGVFWNSGTGNLDVNENYYASPKIPVKPNSRYARNAGATANIFYDADGNYLRPEYTSTVFTVPADAYFVTFNIANSTNHDGVQLELGSTPTTWTPYSNICPITGWTMVNLYQAGENMEDARVYRFTFPSEAGIVYGGTLDVISGELVVDRKGVVFDGSIDEEWFSSELLPWRYSISVADIKRGNALSFYVISNLFETTTLHWSQKNYGILNNVNTIIVGYPPADNNIEEFRAFLAANPLQVVYLLETPLTYHLTPQQITTLLGQNYIWADTGDTEVKFTNVKELY